MNAGDEPPLLTFQWRERYHPLLRLSFFTLVSFAAAAGFFLLFKVVYPQPRHFSTAPQQLLVLDPNQASTRDIVNRTTDENFLLLSAESDPANPGAGTHDSFPVFRPSFAGFEMNLLELPGEEDERTLPRVFSVQNMPLPPIPTVMKAQPPPSEIRRGPPSLHILMQGDLAKRRVTHAPGLENVGFTEANSPRFQLSVNQKGFVTFALPTDSLADAKQMRLLQKAVSRLRFEAVEQPEVQWGEATFVWREAKP